MRDRVVRVIKDTLSFNKDEDFIKIANEILDELREKNIMIIDAYDHNLVNFDDDRRL